MMCIKHVLLYFLVLPIPAASPIFLLLFVAAAFIAIKPCGYCLALLTVLFLSTSPHSPFLHPSLKSPSTTTHVDFNSTSSSNQFELPLNSPSPKRSWISFNGGRYSSPNLIGYEEMDKSISSPTFKDGPRSVYDKLITKIMGIDLPEFVTNPQLHIEFTGDGKKPYNVDSDVLIYNLIRPYVKPSTYLDSPRSSGVMGHLTDRNTNLVKWRRTRELPKNYHDFSWKGIGFIIDFGLKRSEEGLKWEIEEVIGKDWIRLTPEQEKQKIKEQQQQQEKQEEVTNDMQKKPKKVKHPGYLDIFTKHPWYWVIEPIIDYLGWSE
ncbi:uncharacterized protein L201_001839 [Kwoniella dendrophila CBS 6074]|uniref:Uncharacterized protein n=1 Tax=Kwoniella dendrophila CBS 6074 TaxID=1295534 RepID=A0AAX4JQ03_9TREE